MGHSHVTSLQAMKCFPLFVDDYMIFIWIYVLHNRTQISSIFLHFKTFVERHFQAKIKMIQSDNGIELKKVKNTLI